eukprot:128140_1
MITQRFRNLQQGGFSGCSRNKAIFIGSVVTIVICAIVTIVCKVQHASGPPALFQCDAESNLCQNDGKCLDKKCYCTRVFAGEQCENRAPSQTKITPDQTCGVFSLETLSKDRRECPNPNFYGPNFDDCENLQHQHICSLKCAEGSTLLTKSGLQKSGSSDSMMTFATCGDQWSVPTVNPVGPSLVNPDKPACVPDWDPSNFQPTTKGGDMPRCFLWASAVGCDCGVGMDDRNVTHAIHVPRTGGSSLKSLLNTEYGCQQLRDKKIRLRPPFGYKKSQHKFYIGQGDPTTSKYFFYARDPISRFMSSFYYAKRCPERKGSVEACFPEKMYRFQVFETPSDLALGLCDPKQSRREIARKMITSSMHMRQGLWYYFSKGFDKKISSSIPLTIENVKKLIPKILFVGNLADFMDDYGELTTALEFQSGDKYRDATPSESHVNEGGSAEDEPKELSDLARDILRYELDLEYKVLHALYEGGFSDLASIEGVSDYEAVETKPSGCEEFEKRSKKYGPYKPKIN